MIFLPVLMAGGVIYAGSKIIRRSKWSAHVARWKTGGKDAPTRPDLQDADHKLAVSMASLGMAAAGGLLKIPALGWLSLPFTMYVFVPVLREAGRSLGKERHVNDQVLTATRLTVCVVMGYTFIAALDAGLQAFSQRLLVRNEEDWRQALGDKFGHSAVWVQGLEQAAASQTLMQQRGERTSTRAAPLMLATFILTIPWLGINRAAAFLTVLFGAHLRKLGPYTARKFMHHAIEQDIVVTHPVALDRAVRVDMLVFDSQVLEDARVRGQAREVMQRLRQREGGTVLAIHVLADKDDEAAGRSLCADLGLEGCSMATRGQGRAELIRQWQAAGRTVCYVGNDGADAPEMQAAALTVVHRRPTLADMDFPCIVLPGGELRSLPYVFELAEGFFARQQFNFIAPIGVDVLDISTTLFLDFGLLYSVMFTYAGLLLGVGNARLAEKSPPLVEEDVLAPASVSLLPATHPG